MRRLLLAAVLLLGLPVLAQAARDPHSHANPQQIRVRDIALDLSVDFAARRISGTSELALEHVDPRAAELRLDTRALNIESVEAREPGADWTPARFRLGKADAVLGAALSIRVTPRTEAVRVRYATAPDASALQWLTPEQTTGKRAPFLFTQSQAIHARSWIPLQDTPAVRAPYRARIHVPPGLRAVMSAQMGAEPAADGAWEFEMPQPIPAYLIALGVGDLGFASTGPRTGVYAEPAILERAAYEFAETEKTMELTEKLYGPYRWGRYDLLVLPPSFPYGGMENPRLTFVTPTVITGDRKLVSLITHELAHSWSGNLVTNATWNDFWLNEGFTTYLTYRVTEAQFGKPAADMERVLGLQDLRETFRQIDEVDRALVRKTPAADPDAVFSDVPYERGSLFLTWLESRVGRADFDAFLRGWFDEHGFKSVTTQDFLADVEARLVKTHPGRIQPRQLQTWLYWTRLPEFAVLPQSDALALVSAEQKAFVEGRREASALPARDWVIQQWQHFLDTMPATVTLEQLQALDQAYGLTGTGNAILASSWLRLRIERQDRAAWPAAEAYLTSVGRMRLISPVYRALAKTPDGLAFARGVYEKASPGYHPIARDTVERLLAAAGKH